MEVKLAKLTKGMKNFLYEDVLPNYIIYSKKMKYAFCTACQREVKIDFSKAEHKAETRCPLCKKKAFYKAEHYIRGTFEDFGCGIIYTKEDCCVVVRHFDVKKIYTNLGTVKYYNAEETLQEYFNKNGWVKGFDRTYYHGWRKLNIRQFDNLKGLKGHPCYHILFGWDYINTYTGNLKSVIKGTPWEYSCLDKIYQIKDKHNYWDVPRTFLLDYLKCPIAEYLYKVGFTNLCQYMTFCGTLPLDTTQKSIMNILAVNKENWKALLKNGNPDRFELKKRQRMSQYNLSESEYDLYEKYFEDRHNLWSYHFNQVNERTDYDAFKQYYTKSLHKLDKYIQSQEHFDMRTYEDHLRMCSDLGYDMENTFIIFPKNLIQEHQIVVQRWNEVHNAQEREKAKKRNEEYVALRDTYRTLYSFEENDLQIVVPNGCEDICAEGQNLRHCVGTYIDKVCKGISIILFVRKITDLALSYYTMELRGNKIIQCRGFKNGGMTDEVRQFITDFARQKNISMESVA